MYGETGRGKTHLIQSVGNHVKRAFAQKKVFYLTAERFGFDFMNAMNNRTIPTFKEKYRAYDVLIVDDIQFFSKKMTLQEEFFHLFNTLHDAISRSSARPTGIRTSSQTSPIASRAASWPA